MMDLPRYKSYMEMTYIVNGMEGKGLPGHLMVVPARSFVFFFLEDVLLSCQHESSHMKTQETPFTRSNVSCIDL
jgi:hypothetical protein